MSGYIEADEVQIVRGEIEQGVAPTVEKCPKPQPGPDGFQTAQHDATKAGP